MYSVDFYERPHSLEKLSHVYPSLYLSICPYVSGRLPLDEYPRNLILETLIKICGENPNFFRIGQNYHLLCLKI